MKPEQSPGAQIRRDGADTRAALDEHGEQRERYERPARGERAGRGPDEQSAQSGFSTEPLGDGLGRNERGHHPGEHESGQENRSHLHEELGTLREPLASDAPVKCESGDEQGKQREDDHHRESFLSFRRCFRCHEDAQA
jgi:hypothetical protein